MTFGEKLREARLQKGFTQEQLARQIGVAKSTLTGYEKGNREPDVFKIKRLIEVLSVDSDYLLGITRRPVGWQAPVLSPPAYSLLCSEYKEIADAFIDQLFLIQEKRDK